MVHSLTWNFLRKWGDSRYQSLGRQTGEDSAPADKPGVLEGLQGLHIVKVACGGWLSAALSADGALYLWGSTDPTSESPVRCVIPGEIALVEIPTIEDSELLDVVDMAVGDNHVAILAGSADLYAVGANGGGQIGLGDDVEFAEDWQYVHHFSQVQSVHCGPKSTFVLNRAQGVVQT